MSTPATIIGGGLVGSLLSIYLARRGHPVVVHEKRLDPRRSSAERGRSINLVVTARGIDALARLGLDREVLAATVTVRGRRIHPVSGESVFQPYGAGMAETNHSISRADLNRLLITVAEREGVVFRFGEYLVDADLDRGELSFEGGARRALGLVFGTDGAGSALRRAIVRTAPGEESLEMLGVDYKELLIPAGEGGSYRIEKEVLHIWPRGRHMMMALPNADGSFTVTLYLPSAGEPCFESLRDPASIRRYFQNYHPDSIDLIESLETDFLANPTGRLGTVRCRPWHWKGRALLLGDAAHAVVPFFGQGMNAGFEDCVVLDRILDESPDDFERAFAEFFAARKPDADAIADMAIENWVEMSEKVADPRFLLTKAVERRLTTEFPGRFRPRYNLVVHELVPYREARAIGEANQRILDRLCAGIESEAEVDLDLARRLLVARQGQSCQ